MLSLKKYYNSKKFSIMSVITKNICNVSKIDGNDTTFEKLEFKYLIE